jgi:hypothetical protein
MCPHSLELVHVGGGLGLSDEAQTLDGGGGLAALIVLYKNSDRAHVLELDEPAVWESGELTVWEIPRR